jgi:hypothetical protein
MKKIFVVEYDLEASYDIAFKAVDSYLTDCGITITEITDKIELIEWHSIEEDGPPPKFGWYLGALNPVNHEEADKDEFAKEGTNAWRKLYGTTKVWYNPDALGSKWWEADPHGPKSIEVGNRITHWASIPECPML